jgi:hypothetical protein
LRWRAPAAGRFEAFAPGTLPQIPDHVGLDVGRINTPLGHHPREARREVASAGADIGDRCIGRQVERDDHLVRLLPTVARGIVENTGPVLGTGKVVLMHVRRRLRPGEPEQRTKTSSETSASCSTSSSGRDRA